MFDTQFSSLFLPPSALFYLLLLNGCGFGQIVFSRLVERFTMNGSVIAVAHVSPTLLVGSYYPAFLFQHA